MAEIAYIEKRFKPATLARIEEARLIIDEYQQQGFDLTLRQLYYQFVARGLLDNKQTEYNKLGGTISDARLAGLIDWDTIVDRTRELRGLTHYSSPSERLDRAARSYHIDKWEEQDTRVEVWIEKDALVGVLDNCCPRLDVDYFSCRGYVSQSAMHEAAERIIDNYGRQHWVILHLGDHDPSGIDMTRDIRDRLTLFCEYHDIDPPEVKRIALTMDQIEELNPPPNPAKATDARFEDYRRRYGNESWELDALDPTTLAAIITAEVEAIRDEDLWQEAVERERREREQIRHVARNWESIVDDEED